MRDQAIFDDIAFHAQVGVVRNLLRALPSREASIADLDAAASEIDDLAIRHAVVLGSGPERQGIAASMANGAGIEDNMARSGQLDRRVELEFSLREALSVRRQGPIGVGEGQPVK